MSPRYGPAMVGAPLRLLRGELPLNCCIQPHVLACRQRRCVPAWSIVVADLHERREAKHDGQSTCVAPGVAQ